MGVLGGILKEENFYKSIWPIVLKKVQMLIESTHAHMLFFSPLSFFLSNIMQIYSSSWQTFREHF